MIITTHLKLINFTEPLAIAMSAGNQEFVEALGVDIPHDWSEEKNAIETFYNEMKKDIMNIHWGSWLVIHVNDNKLIGCGGFKGKPDKEGVVEIGYEIHKAYRNKGLAKEVAKGLTEYAYSHTEVKKVIAHTLAEENASCNVLRNIGFYYIKQYNDPVDGEIWQWEYKK